MIQKLLLAALLFFGSACYAQVPLEVIETKPGHLETITHEIPADARGIWLPPDPKTFREFQFCGGKVFVAMPDYELTFTIVVVPHDTSKEMYLAEYILRPGNGGTTDPPVDPPPTDPPPQTDKWKAWLIERQTLVEPARGVWPRLAAIYRETASQEFSTIGQYVITVRDSTQALLREHDRVTGSTSFIGMVDFFDQLNKAIVNSGDFRFDGSNQVISDAASITKYKSILRSMADGWEALR